MTWNGEENRKVDWNKTLWREVTDHMAVTNEVLKKFHTTIAELTVKVGMQNGRISKLENRNWFIAGGCAVIAFVITCVLNIVFRK